jgi:hypothetical protein
MGLNVLERLRTNIEGLDPDVHRPFARAPCAGQRSRSPSGRGRCGPDRRLDRERVVLALFRARHAVARLCSGRGRFVGLAGGERRLHLYPRACRDLGDGHSGLGRGEAAGFRTERKNARPHAGLLRPRLGRGLDRDRRSSATPPLLGEDRARALAARLPPAYFRGAVHSCNSGASGA